MSETIRFTEQEYRAFEVIAKKLGYKNVDEMLNIAIVTFLAEISGWKIQPGKAEDFVKLLMEESIKNPDVTIDAVAKKFTSLSAPQIETVEVTVKIPKKLLAFVQDKRSADLEEYLSNCLADTIAADIDAGAFGYPDHIKTDYNLKREFKLYRGH